MQSKVSTLTDPVHNFRQACSPATPGTCAQGHVATLNIRAKNVQPGQMGDDVPLHAAEAHAPLPNRSVG
jgi:hypothetical protein